MKDLHFKLSEVVRLAKHAKNSKEFRATYNESATDKPSLWWVKDQGTYLMSNGMPQPESNVSYADGFGLDCDWDMLTKWCGGSDFVEVLSEDIIDTLLKYEEKEGLFIIIFDDHAFTINIRVLT